MPAFLSEDGCILRFFEVTMKTKHLTQGALFCALYVVLCHGQNLLIPDSASFVIQVRAAEALCVLAFFTAAAIGGITLGCFLFNLSFSSALPLDIPLGTLATPPSVALMYESRNVKIKGFPLPGFFLPVIFNGLIVGGELTYYFGGGFVFNSFCVACGEAVALFFIGCPLYFALRRFSPYFK